MIRVSASNCKESCSKVKRVLLTPEMLCWEWETLSKLLRGLSVPPCSWGIENMGALQIHKRKSYSIPARTRENTKPQNTDRQGNKGKMGNLRRYHPLLRCFSDSWMKFCSPTTLLYVAPRKRPGKVASDHRHGYSPDSQSIFQSSVYVFFKVLLSFNQLCPWDIGSNIRHIDKIYWRLAVLSFSS